MHQSQVQPVQYATPSNQQAIVLSPQVTPSPVNPHYHAKCVCGLSIAQIVFGCLAVIFQLWLLINHNDASQIGAGFWTAPFFIIAGSLGVASSKAKTSGLIIASLVMSTLAAVFTIGLLSSSAIVLGISAAYYNYDESDVHSYSIENVRLEMGITISAVLVVLSIVEAVVAIVNSCFGCHGVCCIQRTQGAVVLPGQIQYVQGINGQTQMVIVPMPTAANGQQLVVGGATGPQPLVLQQGQIVATPSNFQQQPYNPQHGQRSEDATKENEANVQPVNPPTYREDITPPPAYAPATPGRY